MIVSVPLTRTISILTSMCSPCLHSPPHPWHPSIHVLAMCSPHASSTSSSMASRFCQYPSIHVLAMCSPRASSTSSSMASSLCQYPSIHVLAMCSPFASSTSSSMASGPLVEITAVIHPQTDKGSKECRRGLPLLQRSSY